MNAALVVRDVTKTYVEGSARVPALSGVNLEVHAGEMVMLVGLSGSGLSGGQKQRVAIARALAGDPEIILADEPTAALDSHTRRTVMQMMRGLAHERGRSVVIVTHDPRVLEFADRIIRIEDGRIQNGSKANDLSDAAPVELLARSIQMPVHNWTIQ